MANPMNARSLDGVDAPTVGDHQRTRGHHHTSVFAKADVVGTACEVSLEASPDGEHWGEIGFIGTDDFDADETSGASTAALTIGGVYYEYIRANLIDAEGSEGVTVWVMSGGNAGSGTRGQPEHVR